MNNDDFNELAGRIQGLTDFILRLTATLEMDGLIDGPLLTGRLRQLADGRQFPHGHLEASKLALHQLADQLDAARTVRQGDGQA